jgi:lactoylglutathione lyase
MPGADDIVLAIHVVAGAIGIVLGPAAILAERRPPHRTVAGLAYLWSVLAVSLTALALVADDPAGLWWLAPLALLTAALALLGRLAPRRRWRGWARAYAHGQGGSYIALITAALVVSLDEPAVTAAWIAPSLVGLPLIERRVRRLTSHTGEVTADRQLAGQSQARAAAMATSDQRPKED